MSLQQRCFHCVGSNVSSLCPSFRCPARRLLLAPDRRWLRRGAPRSPLRSEPDGGSAEADCVVVLDLCLSGCFTSAPGCPRVTSTGSGSHQTSASPPPLAALNTSLISSGLSNVLHFKEDAQNRKQLTSPRLVCVVRPFIVFDIFHYDFLE